MGDGLLGMVNGFVIGWIVGAVVVVVVAALLLTATAFVARLNSKASSIVSALDGAREHTDGLWGVAQINASAERIVRLATTARHVFEPEESREAAN